MKKLTKKTRIYLILLGILLGLFFVLILPQVPSYLPSKPGPHITPIPPAAEPYWLFIYHPKPGQAISLEDYRNNSSKRPSSICMEIWFDSLVGRRVWNHADFQRISIFVDGIQRDTESPIQHWNRTWNDIWHKMMGQPVGNSWGGHYFCVYAPVTAGIHKVDFRFNTSTGAAPTFSWTFEVFENAVPTPTPLPTPAIINRQKHLPPFLRAVYPNPSQIVSLEKYVILEPQDEIVWSREGRSNDYLDEMQGAICLVFRRDALDKLGSLPKVGDWSSRIHLQIDGNIVNDWIFPNSRYYADSDYLQAHCPLVPLGIGKHTVSLYIHPYNADLTSYSWEFTIEK